MDNTTQTAAAVTSQLQQPGDRRVPFTAALRSTANLPNVIGSVVAELNRDQRQSLASSTRRMHRSGNKISMDIVIQLQHLAQHKWGTLEYTMDGENNVITLRAAFVAPQVRDMLVEFPVLATAVQAGDFTFGTSTNNNLLLGSQTGFLPQAGGMVLPLVWFVYLAGAGIKGEKTLAQKFFYLFCYDNGIPFPRSQLLDKDETALQGVTLAKR